MVINCCCCKALHVKKYLAQINQLVHCLFETVYFVNVNCTTYMNRSSISCLYCNDFCCVDQNPTQVATSLQVFHNLGSLHHTVERVVQNCRENLNRNVRSCLDAQSLAQQHAPQGRGQFLTHLPSNLVALYIYLSTKSNCNSTLVSSCWCTVKPCCLKHTRTYMYPPIP